MPKQFFKTLKAEQFGYLPTNRSNDRNNKTYPEAISKTNGLKTKAKHLY